MFLAPDQATFDELVAAAHKNIKIDVAHAVNIATTNMAQEAKVDMITHVPLDRVLSNAEVERIVAKTASPSRF